MALCSHIVNPALKERHWEAFEAATGQNLGRQLERARREGPLTLKLLLALKVVALSEQIAEMSAKAAQEEQLERLLRQAGFSLSLSLSRSRALSHTHMLRQAKERIRRERTHGIHLTKLKRRAN